MTIDMVMHRYDISARMLTEIYLQNWKSFGTGPDERNNIELSPVTLLVGPNASGKSNVIDALRFLQGAAMGMTLADVLRGRWEGNREVWPGIRGHVAEAARRGTKAFAIGCRLDRQSATYQYPVKHRLAVSVAEDVHVEEESLYADLSLPERVPDAMLFDTQGPSLGKSAGRGPGGVIRAALGTEHRKGKSPAGTYSSLRSLLEQVESEKNRRMADWVSKCAASVRLKFKNAVFLDIHPAAMRDYRPESSGPLGSRGENISPVLYSMKNEARLEDVIDWLSELCSPAIETISFDRTKLREVMMFIVEPGGHRISARSVSDGTLRFLGLLVALLTCPKGTLMVLEEPDIGLHPSRIRLLAELLENLAARRQIQILATTHSPTLLAHLSPQALGDVVAFGRDQRSGCTVCSTLRNLPHFKQLRDAKNLEHLISTGWLERAL